MSYGGTLQQPDTDQPARWNRDGEDFVLTFRAVRRKDALRPRIWLIALAAGTLAAVAGSAQGAQVALGVALFVFATAAFLQYYLGLHAAARAVTLRFGPRDLTVTDGAGPSEIRPLSALDRLEITHDGGLSKVHLDASGVRYRWNIGDLHRHNTVLPFVDAVPAELDDRLRRQELRGGTTIRRKVRVTRFRRHP